MNEKEAREIINEINSYPPQSEALARCSLLARTEYDEAKGYLEAIEKAKVLEDALKMAAESLNQKFQTDDTGGKYWADSVNENVIPAKNHIKSALAQWEKTK